MPMFSRYAILTAVCFQGGLAHAPLTEHEKDVVETLQMLFQERGLKLTPVDPTQWKRSLPNLFAAKCKRLSHCRYLGTLIPPNELESGGTSIGDVKLSKTVVGYFKALAFAIRNPSECIYFPTVQFSNGPFVDIMFKCKWSKETLFKYWLRLTILDKQCGSPACKALKKQLIDHGYEEEKLDAHRFVSALKTVTC